MGGTHETSHREYKEIVTAIKKSELSANSDRITFDHCAMTQLLADSLEGASHVQTNFNFLLTLLAFPGAASAADLPSLKAPPAPPPPIFSWEGVYLGAHVGYGLNTVSEQATDLVLATPALQIPLATHRTIRLEAR